MMHKEVVARKRTHVIAITLLLITCMIYLYQGINALDLKNKGILQACNFIVTLATIFMILREYNSCKISYKYSIIGDKLIINRFYRNKEENLESIRIDDIIYIGKKNAHIKKYRAKCVGKYTCDIFSSDNRYCIYKKDDKLVKFNFVPSENLIKRLIKCNKTLIIE